MTKSRRWFTRYATVCIGAAGALIASLLTTPSAQSSTAHNFDWFPDTGAHSYCLGSTFVSNGWSPWAHDAMANLEAQTIVDATFYSNCADPTIDARWVLFQRGELYGEWECEDNQSTIVNGQWVCKSAYIKLNPSMILSAHTPGNQATKTSCHELGHGVGLAHYDFTFDPEYPGATACLRRGEWATSWGAGWNQYAPHHVSGHIDPWFN
ncbi:hypothetical protein [Nocardioides zeae]|uniref:Matrixin family metalloprotease n=1 Tax=Nocardioides zeae TaxID=1457234 RepID=A0A6P0HNM3_9ACTN|nr:hypothetical protein [Nocardioides zeae]NEN80299.1 hypothetical protein [Nocardioides zeae]